MASIAGVPTLELTRSPAARLRSGATGSRSRRELSLGVHRTIGPRTRGIGTVRDMRVLSRPRTVGCDDTLAIRHLGLYASIGGGRGLTVHPADDLRRVPRTGSTEPAWVPQPTTVRTRGTRWPHPAVAVVPTIGREEGAPG